MDLKLVLRIQSYYCRSKVIILDPKLLLWIQSFYSGSEDIISDQQFLLWIQGFYFRCKDPIQFNIPKLKFEHVTPVTFSSPFNMAAQGEEF